MVKNNDGLVIIFIEKEIGLCNCVTGWSLT